MTLKQWHNNGWLKPHETSRQEIGSLLAIVHRDLADARKRDISNDWRFGIADDEANELIEFTESLERDVLDWLGTRYPERAPK